MGLFSQTLKKLGSKKESLYLNWDYSAGTQIFSPVVSDDIDRDGEDEILFGTKDGSLVMIKEGKQVWSFSIEAKLDKIEQLFVDSESVSSIYSQPEVADINNDGKKEIIFGSDLGNLYVLDSLGRQQWAFKTKGEVRGSVLVADINNDGKLEIVFGSNDKTLYVLDVRGKPLWVFKADAGIESTPALLDNGTEKMIIFGSGDGTIYSVSPKGELIWTFKTNGKITAQPVIGDLYNDGRKFIILGSSDNFLYVITDKGILEWSYQTGGRILAKASLADINDDKKLEILFGSCDDNLYALSPDGSKIWSYETNFWIVTQPIITDINKDGKLEVVVASYDHNVYVLDAEGTFLLDYMPGISSVVEQTGHYTDVMTEEPGRYVGKMLYKYKTQGILLGCDCTKNNRKKEIVVNTKNGAVDNLIIKKEEE